MMTMELAQECVRRTCRRNGERKDEEKVVVGLQLSRPSRVQRQCSRIPTWQTLIAVPDLEMALYLKLEA